MDPELPPSELHRLLGLPANVDAERLRYTYEQHVADAASRMNMARAKELSAAFDMLDSVTKSRMYAGRGLGQRSAPVGPSYARAPIGAAQQMQARNTRSSRPHRGQALAWILGLGFLVVMAIITTERRNAHRNQLDATTQRLIARNRSVEAHKPRPPTSHPPVLRSPTSHPSTPTAPSHAPSPVGSWIPLQPQSGQGWIFVVPSNALVGPDGFAQIACRDRPYQATIQEAAPGQQVSCASGAQPLLRVGALLVAN